MVSTQTLVIAAAATTVLAPVAAPLVLYAAGFGASGKVKHNFFIYSSQGMAVFILTCILIF